jgi:hypothetical protein
MDDQLMRDPAIRRRWLLTKALEIAPLGEALAMAQAAEDFISGTAAYIADRTASKVMQAPTFGSGPKHEETRHQLSTDLVINAWPMVGAEALVGLSSFAMIDDVTHYLRQSGEVFTEHESADELLVRANLKRAEQRLPLFVLLPGVPPTKTAIRDKPDRTDKAAGPRLPTARERAEWARRIVALDKTLEPARASDEFLRGGVRAVSAPALPIVPVMEGLATDPCPVFQEPGPALMDEPAWAFVDEAEPDPTAAEASVVEEVCVARTITDPRRLVLIQDVVRYLRQRDDIVVPKGEDLFLVNGRFRLSSDELISRANRMRERDGKSTFQLSSLLEAEQEWSRPSLS